MEAIPTLLCAAITTLGYIAITSKSDDTQTGGGRSTKLDDSNFRQALADAKKNNEILFIKLYAPWCGYCQDLAPIWKDLEKTVKNSEGFEKVKIVEIDADSEADAKKYFDVQSFPTIVLFDGKKNKFFKYGNKDGQDRSVPSFMKYLKKHN